MRSVAWAGYGFTVTVGGNDMVDRIGSDDEIQNDPLGLNTGRRTIILIVMSTAWLGFTAIKG